MHRRLRSIMTYHNISQMQMAEDLGFSRQSLSNKINNRRDWHFYREVVPIVEYLNGLSEHHHYSVDEVFEVGLKSNKEGR